MFENFQILRTIFFLGNVFHHDNDAAHTSDQIHGAAHALDHLAGNHPVGEITGLADLHCAEDCEVNLAATDHRKRICTRKNGRPWDGRHGLLACVDQIRINLPFEGKWTDAQQSIFGLKPNRHAGRNMVGDERRQPDAEVDVVAVAQFQSGPGRHLITVPRH